MKAAAVRSRGSRTLLALLAALCLVSDARGAESSSPSYVLQQTAAGAGSSRVSSPGYVLGGTAAQPATVGASSSPSFVLQSGFWGFGGSGLVPVLLMVTQNASDPTHIDLSWSGNNPPYTIYEATDCASLTDHYLATTPANAYSGIEPPPATLVCYKVLATAPGPLQPPRD